MYLCYSDSAIVMGEIRNRSLEWWIMALNMVFILVLIEKLCLN